MSRWESLYSQMARMEVDDILTYSTIMSLLGVPQDTERSFIRSYVYRAIRELETKNHRTMECTRGLGYRLVGAHEHERLIRRDIQFIIGKGNKAFSKATNVRMDELDPDQRRQLSDLRLHLSRHAEMVNKLSERVPISKRLKEAEKLFQP